MSVLGSLTDDGDRVAITVDGESLTRGELAEAAAAVADRVQGAAVVAIDARPAITTVVAVVGCLLAGVVAVPVPPDSGPMERGHILRDSRAQLWLGAAQPDVAVSTVAVEGRSTSTWTEPAEGPALILYTSGTTGSPKGVPMQRSAIAAGLDGLRTAWAWTPDDRLVHGLPLYHVHGLVLGLLGALRVGSHLEHTGRPIPAAYAAAGGSLYFGVPTVWGRVAADPDSARALRSARLLVSGSAGLPAPVFADLAALAGQGPIERYGMTETLITLAARSDGHRQAGWVGGPIDGVEARLVDDAGAPVPPDGAAIGNLQVRGATVFAGYLDRPEVTAAAFTADGWFRTGDAALLSPGGEYRIVGRMKDDLIKTGGFRVGAGEIEAALLGHAGVAEAAVVGIADPDLGQRIVAYVVRADVDGSDVVGSGVDEQRLIDHVGRELSAHKRPREVRFVTSLPRNALGKVQKGQLT